jgi:hypothetical protein
MNIHHPTGCQWWQMSPLKAELLNPDLMTTDFQLAMAAG